MHRSLLIISSLVSLILCLLRVSFYSPLPHRSFVYPQSGAYAAMCSASYKPVTIDTSDEEAGMARMQINYLELTSDVDLYVKLKGCPTGTIPPSATYVYVQNCNKNVMGGECKDLPSHLPTYPPTYLPTYLLTPSGFGGNENYDDDDDDDGNEGDTTSRRRALLQALDKDEDASPTSTAAHKLRQHLKKTAQSGYKPKKHGKSPPTASFASQPVTPDPADKAHSRRQLLQFGGVTYCPTDAEGCEQTCTMKGTGASWAAETCSCGGTVLTCTVSPFVDTCAPDADILWADPLKYVCGVEDWGMVHCKVHDPSEYGDDVEAGVCCPPETPNLLINYAPNGFSNMRCTAAEYENLNNQYDNPLSGQAFDTSDIVAAVAEIDLAPMTLKTVYSTYGPRASDMLQGLVYAGFDDCDADQMPGAPTCHFSRV